jgi:hypothetical protein
MPWRIPTGITDTKRHNHHFKAQPVINSLFKAQPVITSLFKAQPVTNSQVIGVTTSHNQALDDKIYHNQSDLAAQPGTTRHTTGASNREDTRSQRVQTCEGLWGHQGLRVTQKALNLLRGNVDNSPMGQNANDSMRA